MTKNSILKAGAGLAAAIALAVGGVAISSGSSDTSATGNGTFRAGRPPGGPRFGAPVTGTAATKATAAALAKYPGTVEQVMKTPAGYAVHVIKSDCSEVHVLVSPSFQVTGTETGPRRTT